MKKLNLITTLLSTLAMVLSSPAQAASPSINVLTVQGFIKLASGSAVTETSATLAFGVYKGTNPIWATTENVGLSGGLFSKSMTGLGKNLAAGPDACAACAPAAVSPFNINSSAITLNTALLMAGATGDLTVYVYAMDTIGGGHPMFSITMDSVPTAFIADVANSANAVATGAVDLTGISTASRTAAFTGTTSQLVVTNGSGKIDSALFDILTLTNISSVASSAALTVAGAAGSATTVGDNTSTSSLALQSGSGGVTISAGTTGNLSVGAGTTSGTITIGNASTGSATFGNTGAGSVTTIQGGSGASGQTIVTSAGTGASAVSITTTGVGGGISIAPEATGNINVAAGATSGAMTFGNASTGNSSFGNTGAGSVTTLLSGLGRFGIGTSTPESGLDVVGTGTGQSAMIVPRDTTANRPTGVNGMIRYNTSTNAVESYENASWKKVSPINLVTLSADVANSTVTIADVTGLSFAVVAGVTYRFRATIIYSAAAATTGSRWSVNGPATSLLAYTSRYSLTVTTETVNHTNAYNIPAAANATSPSTTGNIAIVEGVLTPSANGTVVIRFASEVAASAITAKAGSTLEWW